MERIKKQTLQRAFEAFCKRLGVKCGNKEGEWSLDNAPLYGGWIVVENEKNGGEFHPLLNNRLPAREMLNCLQFATFALQIKGEEDA